MSDNSVEKSFLFLVVLSLVLHAGVIALLYYAPTAKPPQPKDPVFIDLQQIPELQAPQQPRQQETHRQADRQVRVEREMAPRGQDARDSLTPSASPPPSRKPQQPQQKETAKLPAREVPDRSETPITPGSSASGLLKPRPPAASQVPQPQLFPGASRMAKLEENYRKKFENDIAEGDTRFLNSNDIQFGSFLRRFENAVYGVWRYPHEAAIKGIEGITPVRITFNRQGEIVGMQLLESSGAKILDDEVFRTLKMIGPVGAFPKGYNKDEFHLIAFFQYGGARRSLR
jgi:protein TonB